MTERELWKALADGCLKWQSAGYGHPGLCLAFSGLCIVSNVSHKLSNIFRAKIEAERTRLGQHDPYIWPRRDIQSRIDFCNRMIKELATND